MWGILTCCLSTVTNAKQVSSWSKSLNITDLSTSRSMDFAFLSASSKGQLGQGILQSSGAYSTGSAIENQFNWPILVSGTCLMKWLSAWACIISHSLSGLCSLEQCKARFLPTSKVHSAGAVGDGPSLSMWAHSFSTRSIWCELQSDQAGYLYHICRPGRFRSSARLCMNLSSDRFLMSADARCLAWTPEPTLEVLSQTSRYW